MVDEAFERQMEAERALLFHDYNEVAGPLVATAEARLGKFLQNILNETRAFLDHIARSYLIELPQEKRTAALARARSHLTRIKLDCFKVLVVVARWDLKQFHREYRRVRLGLVNSGQFLPGLVKRRKDAESKVRLAKIEERRDSDTEKEVALNLWQEATLAYDEIEEFIKENTVHLVHSATHQRRRSIGDIAIGIVIGFAGSLLANQVPGFAGLKEWVMGRPNR